MKWLVQLMETEDGKRPDTMYEAGTVIEDRRSSAHDLIDKANEVWGTTKLTGERYKITPVAPDRSKEWKVLDDGSVKEQ